MQNFVISAIFPLEGTENGQVQPQLLTKNGGVSEKGSFYKILTSFEETRSRFESFPRKIN
jgi:hypothetical protein